MKFLSYKLRKNTSDIAVEPRSDKLEHLWMRHAEVRAMQKVSRDAAATGAFSDEQAEQNETITNTALRDIENKIDALLDIDIKHLSMTDPTCAQLRYMILRRLT